MLKYLVTYRKLCITYIFHLGDISEGSEVLVGMASCFVQLNTTISDPAMDTFAAVHAHSYVAAAASLEFATFYWGWGLTWGYSKFYSFA